MLENEPLACFRPAFQTTCLYVSWGSCGGVPRTQKLRSPMVGAQGYQGSPLSEPPGVGQNLTLPAAPADRTSTTHLLFLPSRYSSFNFIFSQTSQMVNSEMCNKQWLTQNLLVVLMHFVSPWWLTECKKSCIDLYMYLKKTVGWSRPLEGRGEGGGSLYIS